MFVSDILKDKGSEVVTVDATATVRAAIAVLAEKNIGAVVVSDGGSVDGILSERDIVRHIAEGNDAPANCGFPGGLKRLLVTVLPAGILTGMNVEINEAGENDMGIVEDEVSFAARVGDSLNEAALATDLDPPANRFATDEGVSLEDQCWLGFGNHEFRSIPETALIR